MAEPKPFASLSSGLLARKGTAKPAMRPQGFGQMGVSMEDLGWNDMGHSLQPSSAPHVPEPRELPEHVPSSIAALTPSPRLHAEPAPQPAPPPVVVEQQRIIETAFAEPPEPAPAPAPAPVVAVSAAEIAPRAPMNAAPPVERSAKGGKKAAFTLRLDVERHLQLRLACALTNRSAQQLVTEALDRFLASVPDVAALASQLPGSGRH